MELKKLIDSWKNSDVDSINSPIEELNVQKELIHGGADNGGLVNSISADCNFDGGSCGTWSAIWERITLPWR